MTKEHILNEIRKTAKDGKGLGINAFLAATGIKESDWRGKRWNSWENWGDVLVEAGYPRNDWMTAYEESYVFEALLQLTRRHGKYPTKVQMEHARHADSQFPSLQAIRHVGNKQTVIAKLREYCRSHAGWDDVAGTLSAMPLVEETPDAAEGEDPGLQKGYVYLARSGKYYKIGESGSVYQRLSTIVNALPEGGELIHHFETDDRKGIEGYWLNRFANKQTVRVNRVDGDWFELSKSDVAAFRRRKQFM